MLQQIRYGVNCAIPVEIGVESLISRANDRQVAELESPAGAITAAFAEPLGYPPFVQTVMPGDRVVIAVGRDVPQAPAIVATIVDALLGCAVREHDITVLHAPPALARGEDLQFDRIRAAIAHDIKWVVHDPSDNAQLSYLAATHEAKPVYLNRALCDADVVIPISSTRAAGSPGYFGIHAGLYPTFSDAKTVGRFHAPVVSVHAPQYAKRCEETAEAAWLLGIQFAVQIIPGAGDSVHGIVAGQVDRVAESAGEACARAWAFDVPQRADLVIAALPGDADQQNWESLGRALFAASRICNDDGIVLLCTDIACRPGPALHHLTRLEPDEQIRRRILRERSADAVPASLLLDARGRQHVFLLSRLEQDVVEGLGVGYVAGPQEVQQLVRRCRSCLVLDNAQLAMPSAL